MGQTKEKQIENMKYCYFCHKEVAHDEIVELNLCKFSGGKKQMVIAHGDCLEWDKKE